MRKDGTCWECVGSVLGVLGMCWVCVGKTISSRTESKHFLMGLAHCVLRLQRKALPVGSILSKP